jgi:hypothetical protein
MVREALVRIMRGAGYDNVRVRARCGESFDAAIVIGETPPGIRVGVLLRLPEGRLGGVWPVTVTVDGRRSASAAVNGLGGLLSLLHTYIPTARAPSSGYGGLFEDDSRTTADTEVSL